jgi:peptidoglycan pentaglycine glycine transferase (the first glycine)
MQIKIVTNKKDWDAWLLQNNKHSFLQSWQWGEILCAKGRQIVRLAIIENDKILAQAQIVYYNLPFGWKYAFCPKGPVFSEKQEVWKVLVDYLSKQNCIFFRFEGLAIVDNIPFSIRKINDINPRATIILQTDITKDKLFSNLKSKTRYNIRLSKRKGVTIKKEKDFTSFFELLKKTGKRDKFILHSRDTYEIALKSENSYQLSAMYKGKMIASIVLYGFGDTIVYLYGALDYKYRKLMAPYLLQWQAIQFVKELGYKYYDFFGIAPRTENVNSQNDYKYDPAHHYAGITRFKLGFNGNIEYDSGTHDLLISSNKYLIYKFLRRVRRIF